MSTLDRAFIKAYQKQRIIPAPHVAFPAAEAFEEINAAHAGPPLDDLPSLDAEPLDPAPLNSSAPNASEAVESLAVSEIEVTAPQPVLAISPQPAVEVVALRDSVALPVRAALEVEQFDWPETVETLRLSSVDYFNAWSEQFSGGPGVTILAASNARGAGRTTVLLAAARHLSLAKPEAKIVLVDADFRHPELASQLGVALEIGWEDVFAGDQPLAEALVESNADRITLLPLAAPLDDERLLAGVGRLRESLSCLQQSFDFVCIDAGPLADASCAADLTAFGRELKIDAALIVRDMRRAGDEDNSAIGRRLAQLGVRHWDLVENFVQGQHVAEPLGH